MLERTRVRMEETPWSGNVIDARERFCARKLFSGRQDETGSAAPAIVADQQPRLVTAQVFNLWYWFRPSRLDEAAPESLVTLMGHSVACVSVMQLAMDGLDPARASWNELSLSLMVWEGRTLTLAPVDRLVELDRMPRAVRPSLRPRGWDGARALMDLSDSYLWSLWQRQGDRWEFAVENRLGWRELPARAMSRLGKLWGVDRALGTPYPLRDGQPAPRVQLGRTLRVMLPDRWSSLLGVEPHAVPSCVTVVRDLPLRMG